MKIQWKPKYGSVVLYVYVNILVTENNLADEFV